MIDLDVADLIVIAGQALGIGADAALAQLDVDAAQAALAEARTSGLASAAAAASHRPGAGPAAHHHAAAAAGIALVHALLRHPPFPGHGEQVAVAAGLQFLAVNGWQAELDVPRAAAIIVADLASGRLAPADAASWLAPRLSPRPAAPGGDTPMPGVPPDPRPRAGRIMRVLVAALGPRKHRRPGPATFTIAVGSGHNPGGVRTPATGLVPFTSHARDSLVLARQEARRLGHDRPDCCPGHLLLGLIGEGDGVAVKALERLGISRETVRQQAEQITGQGRPPAPPGPETPPARRIWHAALDEAVADGRHYIGTEHLLLAQYCDGDGPAAQALAMLGATESEVRGAITAVLAESGRERCT